MTKNELLRELRLCISLSEQRALTDMDAGLVIGKYNRQSMLSLLQTEEVGDREIDADRVRQLHHSLQTYLDRYMEQKEGHKWVILASLYHAFILEIPLHPTEITKIKKVQTGGRTEYYCPCKDTSNGSLCHFCVCREYDSKLFAER